MADILVTGIAVHDIVFEMAALPAAEGKHYAKSRVEVVGGIAANASIAVARLGGKPRLATCLGNDASGRAIAKSLQDDGIDLDAVCWADDCQTSLSTVLVDQAGERLLVNHADPALYDRDAGFIGDDTGPLDAVLVDTRWIQGAVATLKLAHARQIPSVIDFDSVPLSGALDLINAATHVVFGQSGLRDFSGEADPAAGLRWAGQQSDAFLAVTLGPKGVVWLDGRTVRSMPAFPVRAVDTLAAGDVFHGAFALALGEGLPIEHSLRFASAVAALKCRSFGGGKGTPDRQEVMDFLEER